MQILSVASEFYPLAKTGGLADVTAALPAALKQNGANIISLLPAYNFKAGSFENENIIHEYSDLFGEQARLIACKFNDYELILLDAPNLYCRNGGLYGDINGKDWSDNWKRFAAFSKVAADLAGGIVKGLKFDLVHAHDWQAGLAPLYLKAGNKRAKNTPSIITIHNLAFQGRFDAEIFPKLGLDKKYLSVDALEYYNDISFLKAGILFADAVSTVSPTYAQEILTPEFGMGFDGVMQSVSNRLFGIVNGIDNEIWNPKTDTNIAANYDKVDILKRQKNKKAIEKQFKLDKGDGPLFCVVSRLTEQKGIDVLVDLFGAIIDLGARIIILGTGDKSIEAAIIEKSKQYRGKIGVEIGYDEKLSHQLQSGADAILIPSRFEPCGLTQLYGLRYGCVPIVTRTGGLSDTIIDANDAAINAGVATGFQFGTVNAHEFYHAILRAVQIYHQPKIWHQIQSNGMNADFSWKKSGQAYFDLYSKTMAAR